MLFDGRIRHPHLAERSLCGTRLLGDAFIVIGDARKTPPGFL